MEILYQNKWCKIISRDNFYILQSKSNKYNDQYFITLESALKAVLKGNYEEAIQRADADNLQALFN